MKELYRFRQFLTEGVIKEAYTLPDSDSTTDQYVNNHWDGILKDILRAHTDLRNSKGGESIPEKPSQLDIDIVLGRFDGAGEFMDVDPNEYNEYFDFYDMYLVTQRDEENTKSISDEDYPKGNYDGYTKRDDLPKLSEGKLFEELIPSGWKKIDTSNDYEEEERQGRLMGFEAPMSGIEGDEVDNIYIEQDGDEYEVHVMTAFNNPEYEGPFSSKEEALKVAIQKMEDLKKDWDE